MSNRKLDDDLIAEYLKKNSVTVLDPVVDDSYIDYRKSKNTFNSLHANKIVKVVQKNGVIKSSKQFLDDGSVIDYLSKVKPVDVLGFVGRSFYSRKDNSYVKVIDFDYFHVEKSNYLVERYVCSNGRKYTVASLKKKSFYD